MYPNTWSLGREKMATEPLKLALTCGNALDWVQTLSDNDNKNIFGFFKHVNTLFARFIM